MIAVIALLRSSADLLLTSGGVSVGDCDLAEKVPGEAGLAVDFWKIAVKPGKPMMFGRRKSDVIKVVPLSDNCGP